MRKRHLLAGLAGLGVFIFVVLTADDRHRDDGSTGIAGSDSLRLAARVASSDSWPSAQAGDTRAVRFHTSPRNHLSERYAAIANPGDAFRNAVPLVAAAPVAEAELAALPVVPMATAEPAATPVPATPAAAPRHAAPARGEAAVDSLGNGRFRDRHGVYRTVRALVTAYCPCVRCCGSFAANGLTSTGTTAWSEGAAADPRHLPYGTKVYVPGYGLTQVDDTGGAMRQSGARGVLHLDMRMTYHYEARQWGRQFLHIRIYE